MRLGDLISIKHGFAFKGEFFSTLPTNNVLLTPGNFNIGGGFKSDKNKYYEGPIPPEFILQADDLIVTMTDLSKEGDTLGYSALIPADSKHRYLHNQRIGLVQIANPDMLDKHFLYWFMRTKRYHYQILGSASGSTVKHTSPSRICDIEIAFPPLLEQKKIAHLLDCIEQKINSNTVINDNLEEQAFVLFNNMFPQINNGKKLCGDYIIPRRGKNLLAKDAKVGNVPVVAGGLEPSTYHNVANTQAPVLTISSSGANAGYVSLWDIPVWSSDSSFIDSSMTDSVYFWYVMLKQRQQEIFDSQTGSAQPHIYPKHIAIMQMKDISDDLIQKFNQLTTPLFKAIGNNKCENSQLAKLRDTLLPKLLSGELDVAKVDI